MTSGRPAFQKHTRRTEGSDTTPSFACAESPARRVKKQQHHQIANRAARPSGAAAPRNSDAHKRIAVPRRRGPAGLRDLFRFCRNLWLYAPHSGLSMRARWGWYHYPRRALCTAEVLGARLSKRLICRFLRLLSSILCAVPFSANMQISLSAISVANAFPPPTTAGLCASSRIASNRTTTVSLGCMDSSSFGCLIVLDSSSTYTTRS